MMPKHGKLCTLKYFLFVIPLIIKTPLFRPSCSVNYEVFANEDPCRTLNFKKYLKLAQ